MIRSLSIIHLFLLLAVSYIGGTLLFREMQVDTVAQLLGQLDGRVLDPQNASFVRPFLIMIGFLAIAFILSLSRYTRPIVLLLGAIKSVFFGLAASYLLAAGTGIVKYAFWWFPFQFTSCSLFLFYCAGMSPPSFYKITVRKEMNLRPLIFFFLIFCFLQLIEMTIFHFLIR